MSCQIPYNGLAQTPAMGWDTYNAYGLAYNETTIREYVSHERGVGKPLAMHLPAGSPTVGMPIPQMTTY